MNFFSWLKGVMKGSNAAASVSIEEDVDVDPFNPFPEPVNVPLTDVIDLHTIQPRDVRRVVEEYLDLAHQAGFPVVRIIHGKGIGVQRELVRSVLARTSYVLDWTDAPPEAGGLGATIVRFRR
jgi:dsDNA-specific endonuclease/ATPase MutS2